MILLQKRKFQPEIKTNIENLQDVKDEFLFTFLWKFLTERISNEQLNLWEAKISLDLIMKSINSQANNKSLGNDGFIAEFFYFCSHLSK